MHKDNIIIVGNGTSLLDKENGSKIDEFDNVLRFNAYSIKSFEKHVGTRTTHWFNTINFVWEYGTDSDNNWRMQQIYKQIYIFTWQWQKEKCHVFVPFLPYYPDIIKVEEKEIKEIQEYNSSEKWYHYSSGAIAIWMMTKQYSTITITGFDWWDKKAHHYNDRYPRGNIHNPRIEKVFIDKLISDGKITIL